jgi:hypothetical protein
MSSRRSLKDQLDDAGKHQSDELHETLPSVLRERPTPTVQTQRNRDWEKRERKAGRIVTSFRNIPAELRDTVKQISIEHGVRMGEVGRLFLEYALEAYEQGELTLDPKLKGGRLTLYPDEEEGD